MNRLKKLILFGGIFLFAASLYGQTKQDTLELAKDLLSRGKMRNASSMLESWRRANPPDAGALWLYARSEFWRKKFGASLQLYREAIAVEPGNLYLYLDYAETALQAGRYALADSLLKNLGRYELSDPYAQYVQAKYHFWAGDFKQALTLARSSQEAAPKPETEALFQSIAGARQLRLHAGGTFITDDQPLQRFDARLRTGKYLNQFLDVQAEGALQFFEPESGPVTGRSVQVSNLARMGKSGAEIEIGVGAFQLGDFLSDWTGRLQLTQRLPARLSLAVRAERLPYLWTLAAIDTGLTFHQTFAAIEWKEKHGLWANAGIQADWFADGNQVLTAWGWVLSPALKTGPASFRIGYSYSITDSKENRFVSIKPLANILDPFDPEAEIGGIFQPYFTPEQMRVHFGIAQAEWQVSRHLALTVHAKYGFAARAMNPYLFLDNDASGQVFINRDFLEMQFTPAEAGARLSLQFSERLAAEASYVLTRNFFYELQSVTAGLKTRF